MPGKLDLNLALVLLISAVFSTSCFAESCKEQDVHCATPERIRRVHGTDVHRECWEYKYKMDCNLMSKNDCALIPADKCIFVGEECATKAKEGNSEFCANLKRRFSCEKQVKYMEEKTTIKKNGEAVNSKDLLCNAMCIDGNCDAVKKANPESNEELAKSVGILNAVADMKKSIDADNKRIVNAFNGNKQDCSFHPLSFMQCCRESPSGWGEEIGLGKCTADELNLAKLRNKKQCVEVGVYCETDFIACVDKRRVFCCYDSTISRIINQEAKKQLGRGNGTPEDPDCNGIELSDLERIDLSKADFSDFYNEVVVPNIKIPDLKSDAKQIKEKADDIARVAPNMPDERKGFNPETLQRLD